MSELEQQLREDRALRDAAKALVEADLQHVRNAFSGRSLSERMIDRVGDGAKDVFEQAADVADSHRGVFAAIVGALFLWLARNPIMSLFEEDEQDEENGEPRSAETAR